MRMVHVRHMRMLVTQAHMPMPMGMGFAWRVFRSVLVLMMPIVDVAVRVLHRQMFMLVDMNFGEVQPNPHGHQEASRHKLSRDRFVQKDHGNDRAQKGSCREISARARCAEIPKRKHEQGYADAVAEKANKSGEGKRHKVWHCSARPEAQQEIEGPRDQAFQLHDLERIGKRDFACEIVVEAPGYAGSGNGERPDHPR